MLNLNNDLTIDFFMGQMKRFKEGRRLVRNEKVEYDEEERCFIVNGHKIYINEKGFACYCEDKVNRPNMICKHLAALVYYIGGLEAEDLITR